MRPVGLQPCCDGLGYYCCCHRVLCGAHMCNLICISSSTIAVAVKFYCLSAHMRPLHTNTAPRWESMRASMCIHAERCGETFRNFRFFSSSTCSWRTCVLLYMCVPPVAYCLHACVCAAWLHTHDHMFTYINMYIVTMLHCITITAEAFIHTRNFEIKNYLNKSNDSE